MTNVIIKSEISYSTDQDSYDHSKPDHLEGGGEEPSVSRGFFWPTEVFLEGVLALYPAGADAVREPS